MKLYGLNVKPVKRISIKIYRNAHTALIIIPRKPAPMKVHLETTRLNKFGSEIAYTVCGINLYQWRGRVSPIIFDTKEEFKNSDGHQCKRCLKVINCSLK